MSEPVLMKAMRPSGSTDGCPERLRGVEVEEGGAAGGPVDEDVAVGGLPGDEVGAFEGGEVVVTELGVSRSVRASCAAGNGQRS